MDWKGQPVRPVSLKTQTSASINCLMNLSANYSDQESGQTPVRSVNKNIQNIITSQSHKHFSSVLTIYIYIAWDLKNIPYIYFKNHIFLF